MPPKKSVKISAPEKGVPAVKLSGKSRKRTKPLEVPNITISRPKKINGLDVPDTEKRVNLNTKIALADEVARAQILKAPIEARLPPKKKGRRKKPVVSEFFSASATDVATDVTTEEPAEEIKEPTVVKKTKKLPAKEPLVLKRPPAKKMPPMVKIPHEVKKASVAKKTMGTKKKPVQSESSTETSPSILQQTAPKRKRAADSTEKKPRNKRKKMVTEALEPKVVIKMEVETSNEIAAFAPNIFSTAATQLGRGKRNYVRRKAVKPVATDACNQSSKTQDSCIDPPNIVADIKSPKSVGIKTSKPKVVTAISPKIEPSTIQNSYNADASQPPCIYSTKRTDFSKAKSIPVHSRKTSISSVSNLSWTRDISSSSVTTCVTVSSKDFVRFNNKMPFIVLTNIESEIHKYKANHSDKDSRDDSSSDSDTSEQTGQPSNAGVSSFIYNSPVKVNSLNLSSSSPYSTQNENQNFKKSYGKAAQNLVQALKKIDLEFVNWIQEAEYATSDLNKIKDKLFDILNSEFCAISHCRNLQRITNPDFNLDTNTIDEQVEKDTANKLKVDNENQRIPCGQVDNIAIKCSLNIPKNNFTETNKESDKEQQNKRVTNDIETNTAESKLPDRYRLRSTKVLTPVKRVESDAVKSNNIYSEPKSRLFESSVVQNNQTVNKIIKNTTVVTNRVETSPNESNHIEQISVKDSMIESATLRHSDIESVTGRNNALASNRVAIVCVPDKMDVNEFNQDPTKTIIVKRSISSNTVESNQVGSNRFDRHLSERNPENNRLENKPVEENIAENNSFNNELRNKTVESYPVVNKRLEDVPSKANLESNPNESNHDDTEFVKPSTSGIIARKFDVSYKSSQHHHSSSDSEDFAEDGPIDSFSQSIHDDDDALSLFAESITGIESSRMNTSVISAPIVKQLEEYIPEPVKSHFISPNNYTYCPSKISEQNKSGVVKPVCEKQNADSTSIYKDANNIPLVYKDSNSTGDRTHNPFQEFNEKIAMDIEPKVYKPEFNQQPRLMGYLYPIRPRDVNIIFKGYCFYFLVNKCINTVYKNPCRYIHHIPSELEIKSKLARFTEHDVFIKEYVVMRRHDFLLRKYGLCFVRECAARKLTRILVEMAFDFVKKDLQSEALKVEVVELTLLHLNNIDLVECDDLLKMEVSKNMLLSEVFMEIMTCTQNFSQFKPVFLSLTYFMVNNDRTFKLEVAKQIMERVCILPYDEPVVRAFIQIMRLTSPEIFLNSMVVHFEKQIRSKSEIWAVYESAKSEIDFAALARKAEVNRQVVQAVDNSILLQTMLHQSDQLLSRSESMNDQHHPRPEFLNDQVLLRPVMRTDQLLSRQEMREGVPLPPSPDTTNLDNLQNKAAEDTTVPRITRTIWGATSTPADFPTAARPNSSDKDGIVIFKRWQNKSILHKINGASFSSPRGMRGRMRGMRHHRSMRRPPFDRRLVTFGNPTSGYRPPGPDY